MAFFIVTRFGLVKYSCAFVKRPSQGTSSLASQLTTVSLDVAIATSMHARLLNHCAIYIAAKIL